MCSQNTTIEDATRTIFETEEVGKILENRIECRSGNNERASETARCPQ